MRTWGRRPSPSMIVACIALVVALGGTGLAASLINGNRIQQNSLPGDRVKDASLAGVKVKANTLSGAQINERGLGKVPSAATADVARNAGRLGGLPAAGYDSLRQQTIPSGTTVIGAFGISSRVPVGGGGPNDVREVVSLSGLASADLTDATVNFANAAGAADADGTCAGSAATPSAPPGKVCLYLSATQGAGTVVDGAAIPQLAGSRQGFVVHAATGAGSDTGVFGTWAYTAP